MAPSSRPPSVLVVRSPVTPADISGLCARARVAMVHCPDRVLICDVAAVDRADLVVVDALARLQVDARRLGRRIVLRGADPELRRLLGLTGLCGALRSEHRDRRESDP